MKELWTDGSASVGYYDKDNFYMGEIKKNKKGEKRIVDMAYFRKLKDAVEAAILQNIGKKASSIEEYARLLSAASDRLQQALKPLEVKDA